MSIIAYRSMSSLRNCANVAGLPAIDAAIGSSIPSQDVHGLNFEIAKWVFVNWCFPERFQGKHLCGFVGMAEPLRP
jgi:hypothetical protein